MLPDRVSRLNAIRIALDMSTKPETALVPGAVLSGATSGARATRGRCGIFHWFSDNCAAALQLMAVEHCNQCIWRVLPADSPTPAGRAAAGVCACWHCPVGGVC